MKLANFRRLAKDYDSMLAVNLPQGAQPPRRYFEINSLVELGLKAEDYAAIKSATAVLQQGFLDIYVPERPGTLQPVRLRQHLEDIILLHEAFLAATAIDEEKGEVVWQMDSTGRNNTFYRTDNGTCRFCFWESQSQRSCPKCRSWYRTQASYRGNTGITLVFIDDDRRPVNFLQPPSQACLDFH